MVFFLFLSAKHHVPRWAWLFILAGVYFHRQTRDRARELQKRVGDLEIEIGEIRCVLQNAKLLNRW